jgi:hypothetical protein
MLSIIISSYQPSFFNALEKNIEETCGITFEIIKMDNPNLMGISEAYNKGASKAQFPYLLFLHEDVLFRSQMWGKSLINHLVDPQTGIIGIAGSNYVPHVPAGWYINNMKYQYMNLIQNTKDGSQPNLLHHIDTNSQKVYGIDGVFMAMRKEVYNEYMFNENLKNFHGYDLDIALNVAKKFTNFVVNDILLEHFSLGGADKICFDANVNIREKYGANYQEENDPQVEWERFQNFVYSYFRFHGISIATLLKTISFVPSKATTNKGYLAVLKTYYPYFRYKNYYTKKFQ